MRQRILMLLTIVFGALLQQVLPEWALFGGMKPPILAAMVLHYSLRKDRADMWTAILLTVLLQDGLELGSFGPALVTFPVIGLLAFHIRNEIFSDGLVTQLAMGALTGLFTAFTILLIYSATGQRSVHPGIAILRLFSSIILGMATLPLVSRSLNALESLIPKRRGYGWQ
jgi:rod shape-determining protein MreD